MSARADDGRVVTRLRRPSWRDPRLLLGLTMVALAVALGAWVVGQADHTVPVLAARAVLTPGEPLDGENLAVVRVSMADADRYLASTDELPTGAVVARTVGEGELVPRSAVTTAGRLELRAVAARVESALADGVQPGAKVDLWFTPARDALAKGEEPRQVAGGLTVSEVAKDSGDFSMTSGATVQLLVPTKQLSSVLAVLGAEGSVAVVPVPGTAVGSR